MPAIPSIRVLCGDIGATHTRLAIVEVTGPEVQIEREATYLSPVYQNFYEVLSEFASALPLPAFAAFGVAGPGSEKLVQTTNLPWVIDSAVLQRQFNLLRCVLLNDLEATAWGLPALKENDLHTLQIGQQLAHGNAAIVAAGTGLGEAGLYWDGKRHRPFATEGGHASFSPSNDVEIALLRYLQRRYEHVSWERVVSGVGLRGLHEFLCHYRDYEVPAWLIEEMRVDASAAISTAALSGKDDICVETMNMFVQMYGSEAGNLALKLMSRGGLYLGGGIAPKILPLLQDGTFISAFHNKGRMRPILEKIAVKVILSDRVAMFGAALVAANEATAQT